MHVGRRRAKTSKTIKIMKTNRTPHGMEELSERECSIWAIANWLWSPTWLIRCSREAEPSRCMPTSLYEKGAGTGKEWDPRYAAARLAHVYQRTRELTFLYRCWCPRIENLKKEMNCIWWRQWSRKPHEELIKKSPDEAGKLYQVVIIKTPSGHALHNDPFQPWLQRHWNAAKQAKLDKAMGKWRGLLWHILHLLHHPFLANCW